MKNYYTVPEFAEAVGLTRQYIYQKLNKDLSEYCKIVDGKKLVSNKALGLFEKTNDDEKHTNKLENSLDVVIQLLSKQLDEKDRQIARKDEQIAKKDNQLAEVNKALILLQQNTQVLHSEVISRELTDGSAKKNKWKFWQK